MNSGLGSLYPYPFERLDELFASAEVTAPNRIALTIGEPRHPAPRAVFDILATATHSLSQYPTTLGRPELREAIARWLCARFSLPHVDPGNQILPLNGTREGLFSVAQALVSAGRSGAVVCPNPFYQIYEGAAYLAGTQPVFVNCPAALGFLPDFESVTPAQWQSCQMLYLCSPGNPSGAVLPIETLQTLIDLAHQYDFVIASDECYSEIYRDESNPPVGLLQASHAMGNPDFARCLCFHSLSKRSSLPGLRSGFVAGDAALLARFAKYRTYHGCAMPVHHQLASEWAWSDEEHVRVNRALYRAKFEAVTPILAEVMAVPEPEAGFYLWPETPIADPAFAVAVLRETGVAVLPGSYLARTTERGNPGANRVRIALVAELSDCVEAAERIAHAVRRGVS